MRFVRYLLLAVCFVPLTLSGLLQAQINPLIPPAPFPLSNIAGYLMMYENSKQQNAFIFIPGATPEKVEIAITQRAANRKILSARIITPFTIAYYGYKASIVSGTYDGDERGLLLTGTVQLPGFSCSMQNARLNSKGWNVDGQLSNSNGNISVQGWTIQGSNMFFENNILNVSGKIVLPNSMGSIDVTAYYPPKLTPMLKITSFPELNISGYTIHGVAATLNSGSVSFSGVLPLPNGMGNIQFQNLIVTPDGKINQPTILAKSSIQLLNLPFQIAQFQFLPSGIALQGTLQLTSAHTQLKVSHLLLYANGNIDPSVKFSTGETIRISTLPLTIDSTYIKNNQLVLGGSVTLPNGMGNVRVGNIVVNNFGTFTGGTIVLVNQFLTYEGFNLLPTSGNVDFIGGRITLSGNVIFPEFGTAYLQNVEITSAGIQKPGSFVVDPKRTYNYKSYIVNLQEIENISAGGFAPIGMKAQGKILVNNISYNFQTDFMLTPSGVTVQKINIVGAVILNGFMTNNVNVSFGQDQQLHLSGTVEIPQVGSLPLADVIVSGGGILSQEKFSATSASIAFSSLPAKLTSAMFNGKAISMNGEIVIQNIGMLKFTGANIQSDGSFADGTITAPEGAMILGFPVSLSNAYIAKNGVGFTGTMSVGNEQNAYSFHDMVVNNSGIIAPGVFNVLKANVSIQGFPTVVTNVSLTNGSIWAEGIITLPTNLGSLHVKNARIISNGTTSGGTIDVSNTSLNYGGTKLLVTSATIGNNELTINGTITLPAGGGTTALTGLVVKASGIVQNGVVSSPSAATTMKLNGYTMNVTSLVPTPTGMEVSGSLKLPNNISLSASKVMVSSTGAFSGGSVSFGSAVHPVIGGGSPPKPPYDITVAGFGVKIRSIEIESNAFEFDGSASLPNGGQIEFTSVDITPEGTFTGGSITYNGSPLRFAGGTLSLQNIQLAANGITAAAMFTLPNNLTVVQANNVTVLPNGRITVGSFAVDNAKLNYHGFVVALSLLTATDAGIVVNGLITMPKLNSVTISNLAINPNGGFSGGAIALKQKTISIGSSVLSVDRIGFASDAIFVDGSIQLPKKLGNVVVQNMSFNASGQITEGRITTSGPLKITYSGVALALTSARFEGDEIEFDGTATLPKNLGTMNVTGFEIGLDGTINPGTMTYSGSSLSVGGLSVGVNSAEFSTTSGITMSATVKLPQKVSGTIALHNLLIGTDGSITIGGIAVNNVSTVIGTFTTTVTSASYASGKFLFSGIIHLPGQYGTVNVTGLSIQNDGTLTGGTLSLQGTTINHNGFTVNNLTGSLSQGLVSLNGLITLPTNLGTVALTGLTLNGKGVVSLGKATLRGTSLTWRNYSVNVDSLSIGQGDVRVNGKISLGKTVTVTAEDLRISTIGAFSGGKIVLQTNSSFNYNGFQFALTEAVIQNDEVELSGKVTLPGNRGTVSANDVNISYNGTLSGGLLTYTGAPFTYNGYSLALKSLTFVSGGVQGTATFAFGGAAGSASITITSSGSFTVTNFNLQNVKLTYAGFVINDVAVTTSGDSMYYSGTISVPRVGEFSVTNMTALTNGTIISPGKIEFKGRTFAWGNYSITVSDIAFAQNAIRVNGSIAFPGNIGIVNVTDLTISTTGALLNGTISAENVKLSYKGYMLAVQSIQFEGDGLEMNASFSVPNISGTFSVQNFEVGLIGTVNFGSVTYSGESIAIGGFSLTNISVVTKDLSDISLNGTITFPTSVGGSAKVTGLTFGSTGTVGIQSISVQGVGFAYKGFTVKVDAISYASERMSISGTMTLPQGYGTLKLTDLQFDAQGNFYGGTIAAQGTTLSYKGFKLTLDNASIGTDDVMALSGSVQLPNSLGTLQLTGFQMKGTSVVDLGKATLTGTTLKWKNYVVNVDTLQLLDNSVMIDGSVNMGSIGTVRAEGLQIGSNGSYYGGTISFGGLDSLKIGGFVVNITNVSASGTEIEVDGSISLPNVYGTIIAKGVNIRTDGSAAGGMLTYSGPGLSYNGAKLIVTALSLVKNGISVSANLQLPNNLATLTANNVTLSYPMQISVGSIGVGGVSFTKNGFTFQLTSATYEKTDLVVNGSVTAPVVGTAKFTNLKITSAGELDGGTIAYSNTFQWGKLGVAVKNISYDWSAKLVTLSGSVALPDSIGTINITSLEVDASTGAVKQAEVALDGSLSYGGLGLKDPKATFANNEIEFGGTIVLDPERSLTVNNVDINVQSGSVSGGTIHFDGPAFTFAGLEATIDLVNVTHKKFDVTATVTLPGSMGVVTAKDATFGRDGSFSISSVLFSGQSLSYKGFGFTVKDGTITKNAVSMDVTVTLSGNITFGIDKLQYSKEKGFNGGDLNFSQTKINYKGYVVSISSSKEKDANSYLVGGHFALPESKGTANVDGIIVSSTGVSFTSAKIDWGSLPNLLPKGFTLKVTDAEFVEDGFEVSGTVSLSPFFDLTAKNLIITSKEVQISELQFDVGQLSVGTWSFGGMSFDFTDTQGKWRVNAQGSIKLAGKIEGFTLKGSVGSNGDFLADLTASTSILLGESGAELIKAEGAFAKQANDYQLTIGGTFAPVGMQNFVSADGILNIDFKGVITGTIDVDLFSTFTMAKSTMVIDIPQEKFTVNGSLGVKQIIAYTGDLEVDASPFQVNGKGDVEVAGYSLAQSTMLIDTKQFSMQGSISIPNPSGGNPLIDLDGHITMIPANSYVDASGDLKIDGYDVAFSTFRMSPDSLYGKGSMNFIIGNGDFEFLALGTGTEYKHAAMARLNSISISDQGESQDGTDDDFAVDMAFDVLKSDYTAIYQELELYRNAFAVAREWGFTMGAEAQDANNIANEVIAAVNIAGIDPEEFKSNIVSFIEGQNVGDNRGVGSDSSSNQYRSEPSYGYYQPGLPPYTTTEHNRQQFNPNKLIAHLTDQSGKEYNVPFSALQLDATSSDARETTLDLTPAFSDVIIPIPNSDEPFTVKGDDNFWEMMEMSEAVMPASSANYKLKYFKCDVAISFKGMTFDKTTILISQGTFQGTSTVHIPGFGEGEVQFSGNKSGVTSFTGSFDISIAGFTLAAANVSYSFDGTTVTITANGSANFAGSSFVADASLSDSKNGGFTINSFTLKGSLGIHTNFHFDFHWKCFHIRFSKNINVNFATATFSYSKSKVDGSVSISIPFPWPIHTKHISFGVDISPHELDLCFDLFGNHCAAIKY
ncbi:MAG: hypothetical protein WDA22_15390 [Bacteroidota bacterium]